MKKLKVGIYGMGKVGTALARAFSHKTNIELHLGNRTLSTATKWSEILNVRVFTKEHPPLLDVLIISVKDDAISKTARHWSKKLPTTIIAHTSGSLPIHILRPHTHIGLFYPLDSFGYPGDDDLTETPILTEGDTADLNTLDTLAGSITQNIYHLSYAQRQYLHLSAVWVNNFTNVLLTRGWHMIQAHVIPIDIIYKLLDSTVRKAIELGPADSQTGPAIRADYETMEKHLALLDETEDQDVYRILSKLINPDLKI